MLTVLVYYVITFLRCLVGSLLESITLCVNYLAASDSEVEYRSDNIIDLTAVLELVTCFLQCVVTVLECSYDLCRLA